MSKTIMDLTIMDLKGIAAAGGGMIIDASKYSTSDLKAIAAAARTSGAQIILKNISSKTSIDMKAIAAAGKGCVIFDLIV
jgi:hypothetical protein